MINANAIEQLQILYEISMSVGSSLDLRLMLRNSLSTLLKRLNCSAGGVLFLKPEPFMNLPICDRQDLHFEQVFSIPRNTASTETFQEALSHVTTLTDAHGLAEFYKKLPFSGQRGVESYFHILELPDVGLLILTRNGEDLDSNILKSLKPLMYKLAGACKTCEQNKALRESEMRYRESFDQTQAALAETQRVEEELRASHRIIEGIINAIPVRVFWKNRDLVFLGCNAIFAKDAGFDDPKDIIGKDDYQMGWRDQAELYRCDDRQVIESGRSKLFIEEPQTTPEGNTIVLLTSKMPLRNSEGEIIGVLGTYMDITDQKHAEEALHKAHDELELKVKERTYELETRNAEMERFVYTVSHDLRTPLISISGFMGFLEQDADKGDLMHMKADIQIVNEAVTKMDSLLHDTLELSRIGRIVNPSKDVPFGEIVKDALEQVAVKIHAKNVTILERRDWPVVRVDKMRISEVLVNLVENSLRYMGDQPNPEIELGYLLNGEETTFFVLDNGIGIDPSQHDKVFGLFYKVEKESKGTGVGLAIVKRIIEVHGGRIWIDSKLGKGCSVFFTLPLAVHQ
jgi:PAS domain S-box-containing protein